MEQMQSIKTILYLLIATILLISGSLVTEKPVFLWAALFVSVALFLNLYWLGIGVIAHFIGKKRAAPLKDIKAFFERDPASKRSRSPVFSDLTDQISD